MIRHFLITAALIITFSLTTQAQENAGTSFDLQQCITYALQNRISVKNSIIDEEIADAKVKETIGIGLPQINGSASITQNQKLPRFFTQYSPGSGFIDLGGVTGLDPGDVVAAQNFFQLRSSGSASLSVDQILFNGSYLVGLQATSTYKELSVRNTNLSKEQVVEQVSKAYYLVLVNRERMKLFTSNINRVDSLYSNTKALFENGFAEGIDVDRIEVTLNNLKTEQSKFEKLQVIGIELLKFQMNYPLEDPIEISGDLADESIEEVIAVDKDYYLDGWDWKSRTEYQILETNYKLQTLNVKNGYAQGMPRLSAFANLGYSTQSANIPGLFQTNTNISDSKGIGPDKWYSFSTFGVNLNVPIFSGLQRTRRVQQEKLNLQKIENEFKSLEWGIEVEIKRAALLYQNAKETLISQKRNMDLADNVARVTKIKYEQGVGSNIEVVDAESTLREAQINYYNALFDALVAKTDLDKAFGKLLPASNNEN